MTRVIVSRTGWRKSGHSGGQGTECAEVAAVWRKSSHSGGDGTECVEVARTEQLTAVRDSKNPDGAVLRFSHAEWSDFLTRIKYHSIDGAN